MLSQGPYTFSHRMSSLQQEAPLASIVTALKIRRHSRLSWNSFNLAFIIHHLTPRVYKRLFTNHGEDGATGGAGLG